MSSIGSLSSYFSTQWPLQSGGASQSGATAPSDPLQALYQAFTGGGSSADPLLSAIGQDDGSGLSSNVPQFSPDMMQALFSAQSGQGSSGSSPLQTLFDKFDANGDGKITQSEFENAIGSGADQSNVDALFNAIDSDGDGSISEGEVQSAMQKAQGAGGGHHHHHHAHGAGQSQGGDPLQSLLSGASADGTTSQTSTNSDGSSTTTITYSDGTKVEMTTPAASSDSGNGNTSGAPNALNFSNLLKQMISLQAQLVQPTTNLSV